MSKISHCLLLAGALALGGCAAGGGANSSNKQTAEAARIHTELGTAYLREREYEAALEKLNKALSYDADYAPAHTVLGVLYERLGQSDKAGRHYRRAAQADPDDGGAQNNYGSYLCRSGQHGQAYTYFEKAVDNPFYRTPEVALSNAGHCALAQNETDRAEQYLRRALEYSAGFRDALYPMAQIQFDRGQYLSARAFLQRYESVGQPSPEALLLGYRIEDQLGDRGSAERYQGELLKRYPESPQAQELKD